MIKITVFIFLMVVLLCSGCNNNQEEIHKLEQKELMIDHLKTMLDDCFIENSGWQCIKWNNDTEINSKWIDNCCMPINFKSDRDIKNLTLSNFEDLNNLIINVSEQTNETNKICFEFKEENNIYSSISLENSKIDLELCKNTPKKISNNKTICVLKEKVMD